MSVSTPRSQILRCAFYFIKWATWRGDLSGTYFTQVEQKHLEKRTFLSVPGYDPKEKFEFGVITSFVYPIENSGWQVPTQMDPHY